MKETTRKDGSRPALPDQDLADDAKETRDLTNRLGVLFREVQLGSLRRRLDESESDNAGPAELTGGG